MLTSILSHISRAFTWVCGGPFNCYKTTCFVCLVSDCDRIGLDVVGDLWRRCHLRIPAISLETLGILGYIEPPIDSAWINFPIINERYDIFNRFHRPHKLTGLVYPKMSLKCIQQVIISAGLFIGLTRHIPVLLQPHEAVRTLDQSRTMCWTNRDALCNTWRVPGGEIQRVSINSNTLYLKMYPSIVI